MGKTILEFPYNFHFGTSTAAYQVEGDSGERKTDWDVFMKENPLIIKPGEKGPEWWKKGKAEEDIRTIATLGMKIQRIGFEWGRIEPEKGIINHTAINRYKEIVSSIIDNGMVPVVTLNHYVLPEWVAKKGSWNNSETVNFFKHYVKFIVQLFPEVTYWLTLNEPNVVIIMGYISHYFPPQDNNVLTSYHVWLNLVNAHIKAYKAIKEVRPDARVGATVSFRWNRAENEKDMFERGYANFVNNFSELNYLHKINKHSDFIGCNYYTGYFLDLNPRKLRLSFGTEKYRIHKTILFGELRTPNAYESDYGWPIVPDFFLDLLRTLHKNFDKPIIITENGIADHKDKNRAFYILTHLVALWRALKEGVNVAHYIHWATVDNLEWIEGYSKKFGLIGLDPVTGERHLRHSANLYKEIAQNRHIDVEYLLDKYLEGEQKIRAERIIRKLIEGRENQSRDIL
jgi:beta-glucosidase